MPAAAQNDPSADIALAQRVLRENIASVYSTYIASTLTHMVFVIVFGAIIYSQLKDPSLLFWLAALLIADIYVLFTPRWTPGRPAHESAYWARKISRMVTLVSMVTAVVPWLIVPHNNLPMTSLLMTVIVGSCARAAQSLWPLKPALFGYTMPMSLGMITALAWQGDGLHLFLAAVGAAYLLLTLHAGTGQHKLLTESLMLRFENEALAVRLGEQIAATERASEEKTRFLGTASHDLRQPLHAIALFGAALRERVARPPRRPQRRAPDARGERAGRVAGHHARRLAPRRGRDHARAAAGAARRAVPAAQPHLRGARRAERAAAARARQRPVGAQRPAAAAPHAVQPDGQRAEVHGARRRDRARRATAATRCGSRCATAASALRASSRAAIFEEFYQVNNPGRDRSRGLGIGLSIVQRLSRLLGHPVQMHSRPGRGTFFRVVVPAIGAPAGTPMAAPCVADAPAAFRNPALALPGRVLLLDDELEIREAMTGLLRSHAVDAHAVDSEAAAAAALRRAAAEGRPFDLLLCDYRLADGADGLDAGLRLSSALHGTTTPLLLITGETSPDRLQRVRESRRAGAVQAGGGGIAVAGDDGTRCQVDAVFESG